MGLSLGRGGKGLLQLAQTRGSMEKSQMFTLADVTFYDLLAPFYSVEGRFPTTEAKPRPPDKLLPLIWGLGSEGPCMTKSYETYSYSTGRACL